MVSPSSDSKNIERRADAGAIGCYYEFVTRDDEDEDEHHPLWSSLSEDDREGWRRVDAFINRIVAGMQSDEADPIETALEACSAELAEVTRQRDELLRRLRGDV